MKDEALRMTMLYDFYGELLTQRQREYYDLYHNEDLSLSEIAEHYGISRQGVWETIVRAEAILNDFEDKTGMVARSLRLRSAVAELRALNQAVAQENRLRARSPKIEQLTDEIAQKLAALEE